MSENYELWLENSEYLGLSLNIEGEKKKEKEKDTVELKRVLYLQVLTQV